MIGCLVNRLIAGLSLFLAGGVRAGVVDETALVPVKLPATETKALVLRMGVNDIYCRKTACDCISEIASRSYDGVVAILAKEYRITLELIYFEEVMDLDKAIRARQFDGVICKPWTALRFGKQAGNLKRVADILDPSNRAAMTGMFVVANTSPLETLADLKGKRVAFGQPDSYEKYHSPLLQLAALGVKPATGVYYSSCGENLHALLSEQVDAAVISSYALTASCAVDFAKPEDFRTLATTEEMPLTSVLVDLEKVPPAAATRLQRALLALSGDRTPADLTGKGFVDPVPWQPAQVASAAVPKVAADESQ